MEVIIYIDTNEYWQNWSSYKRVQAGDPSYAQYISDGYIYGYDGEGGDGGIINLPTNTDEWKNISYVIGVSGESWEIRPPQRIENETSSLYGWRYFEDQNDPSTPLLPFELDSGYTEADVNDSFHLEGGSPRGGRGISANLVDGVNEPNATLRYGGDAYLKLEFCYNIPDPIEITNWTGNFDETYEVPDYTYLKVTAKSKGGDGGIATHGNGNENYYYSIIIFGARELHRYTMGSGGGGGADFEGDYYGNEINIQKNNDNITLNYNNKQIVLTPGLNGGNNTSLASGSTYTSIAGGSGGNVTIPTDNDEWLNIVSNNGQSGTNVVDSWSVNENFFFIDEHPYLNYTPPDVNDSFHIAGGSPLANNRGGRGVVGGTIGEPNATLRLWW